MRIVIGVCLTLTCMEKARVQNETLLGVDAFFFWLDNYKHFPVGPTGFDFDPHLNRNRYPVSPLLK